MVSEWKWPADSGKKSGPKDSGEESGLREREHEEREGKRRLRGMGTSRCLFD